MTARHLCLSVRGEQLGDLISVGVNVTLYTVHPQLAHLDGRTFESSDHARAAVTAALDAALRAQSLATPMPARRVMIPTAIAAEVEAVPAEAID